VIVLAVLAVVGITLYFAFGMPGMDHGTPSSTMDHDASAAVVVVDPPRFEPRMRERDAFVVNVHTPYEGEITGTDAFIAYDTIGPAADRLPSDLSTPILVYSRSGNMSRAAATTLTEMGYRDVTDLAGGMEAWAASGRRIASNP
jgi:rhodanese-related sulfurtransferase